MCGHDSAEDDAACGGPPSDAEQPKKLSGLERPRRERRWSGCDGPTVPPSVRDEEQAVIDVTVAQLSRQPPLERLNVVDDRFGFHHESPVRSSDHGVPCPQVAFDREWDLGPPTKARVHLPPEPLEEPGVAGIADRIAAGVGAESDVQSKDGTNCTHATRIDRVEPAVLEAPDLDVIDPGRSLDRAEAQAGIRPRPPYLGRDAAQVVLRLSSASIGWAFTDGHNPIMLLGPSSSLTRDDSVSTPPTSDARTGSIHGRTCPSVTRVSTATTRVVGAPCRSPLVGTAETATAEPGSKGSRG